MLFSSSRNPLKNVPLNIKQPRENTHVEQCTEYKYLGIWLDPHLTFEHHMRKICSKVKARTGILWRMRPYIGQPLAYDLYSSLIEPHFTFGDIIYDGGTKGGKAKLQVAQNTALRAVMNVRPYYSSKSLHNELGEEWLDTKRRHHCCTMTYKGIYDLAPANINALFPRVTHSRTLRSDAEVSFVPRQNKLYLCDNNLPNRSYHYWSKIPNDIRLCRTVNSFKRNVKKSGCLTHF